MKLKDLKGYILTKNGKVSAKGESAINALYHLLVGQNVYTWEKINSGRRTRQREVLYKQELDALIYYLKLDVQLLNDAPRGGMLGEHYKLKRKRTTKRAVEVVNQIEEKLTR